jgi:hypothetical protein
MAIVLDWKPQDRSATYDRGKWSATQNYIVSDTTGQSITVADIADDSIDYQNFGGPTIGNAEPVCTAFFRFVSYTITPVDNGADKIWSISMQFESSIGDGGSIPTTSDVKTETEIGFSSFEVSILPQILEIWCNNPSLPSTDALKSNPDLTDIITGANATFTGKEPVSFVGHIMNISVRNVIFGRPNYLTIASFIGKRNSAAFTFGANATAAQNMVCGIGTLLFTGATTSRIGPNQYEVNYTFSYDDQFYHLRQAPLMDVNGVATVPKTDNTALSAANPWRAKSVYWKQPFPSTAAFSGIGLVTT